MFDKQPGFRYSEYEIRGVPIRVEIGPKDLEKSACAVARRDLPGKEGKTFGIPLTGAAAHIEQLLREIQAALFKRATAFRDSRMVRVDTLEEFKGFFPAREEQDEAGAEPLKFVSAHWDGTRETEDRVQSEFKATIRCLPDDGPREPGICIFSGKPSARRVIFARAY
jgi:prolyl-tRNA synthetase